MKPHSGLRIKEGGSPIKRTLIQSSPLTPGYPQICLLVPLQVGALDMPFKLVSDVLSEQ